MNESTRRYDRSSLKPKRGRPLAGWFIAFALFTSSSFPGFSGPLKSVERPPEPSRAGQAEETCKGEFHSISQPLNDLGPGEYIRPLQSGGGVPTGYYGGLYPDGENTRPPAHEAAGVAAASQIQPLDEAGQPDPADGRIVMISVGMSNTSQEFIEFIEQVEGEPAINPQLVVVNGAQPGMTSDEWVDPAAPTWDEVDLRLEAAGVTPSQVQVAWVKETRVGIGGFPGQAITIEGDLETIARNLLIRYPNIKIAYYSSRTRAYTYWSGLSPEPAAFENGFSVKWMIQKQINGDPALNFAPPGPVVAPFLSWGPYLWADGPNPRSDGFTWLAEDLQDDCTHPSGVGEEKIACLLM
ncbi:MAG TPA: hypothetical protein VJ768_04390, partial [Anaerolineales bacterium]|nr:hypothetical protein [Anaerolineales bacterium]